MMRDYKAVKRGRNASSSTQQAWLPGLSPTESFGAWDHADAGCKGREEGAQK